MRETVLCLTLLVCLSAGWATAQETTGNLEGVAVDADGAPVAYVDVKVTGTYLQGFRSTISFPDGYFRVSALPVGQYSITLTHVSYQPQTFEQVQVRLGQTTNLGEVRLEARVYEMEEVIVSGRKPLIDPASNQVGRDLVEEEFADLPNDRNYRSLATLSPHVLESTQGDRITFGGATGMENKYFIDGVDNMDPFYNLASTDLPYNFVRAVEVRVGGYEAEYRSSMGGTLNAVTRSGSNQFHGQVFGFFLNNSLAADPVVAGEIPETDFARYDFGASLGGALAQDKLWYFIAYNPETQTENITIPGHGIFENKMVTHRFATRLDWRVNQTNDLKLHVYGSPDREDYISFGWLPAQEFETLDPLLYDYEQDWYTVAMEGRHWLSEKFHLATKASGMWLRYGEHPTTEVGREEIYFFDYETGVVSGGGTGEFANDFFTGTLSVAGILQSGSHLFQAGLEYMDKGGDRHASGDMLTRRVDPVDGEYFTLTRYGEGGTIHNRMPAAYLQDSWRFASGLRLNLGIRWDAQYIYDTNGDRALSITDEWQPRLGFTWQPGKAQKHQVSGSFGRFYQDLALGAPFFYFTPSYYEEVYFDSDPRTTQPDTLGSWRSESSIAPEVEGLKGQHFDEFTLAYERRIGDRAKVTMRGVYRTLREAIEDTWSDEAGNFVLGNPGRGKLSHVPGVEREYTALELSYLDTGHERYNLFACYVLSRTYGNFPGIFPVYYGGPPNVTGQWDANDAEAFSAGLLPHDRPHVFKLSGSYRVGYGILVGTSFAWMSGTPLNEFGAMPLGRPGYKIFLQPRGEAGRTPSIWDLNIRFAYSLPQSITAGTQSRLLIDLMHVGSPRKAVNFDEQHFNGVDDDGNQVSPNPRYGQATRYQPPMTVRLGAEVSF